MKTEINDFINYIKFIEQLSENTIKSYKIDLELFSDFLDSHDLVFTNVSSSDIRLFLSQSKYSQSTLARMASTLRRFYQYCKIQRVIEYDPTTFIKVSGRAHRVPKYLSHEEFQQLISFPVATGKDYLDIAIMEILYGSGLRVSELVNLTFSEYFPKERLLRVRGKASKVRMVPLSEISIVAISDYITNGREQWVKDSSPFIFLNRKSVPITRNYVYNMLNERALEVNLNKPISPHILRHSFASELINHGADLRVIQELLGHSDVSTTQIYTHLDFREKKRQYDNFHPGQNIKGDDDEEV